MLKLEVAITDVSQCNKDLTIEVPTDEVKAAFEKAYEAYTRHVKVPGFRPGRVPRAVVKQRYGKEIKDEVAGDIIPHALSHAVQDHKLRPVSEPVILELSVSEGEPLKFKARIEILPEITLGSYKGLEATRSIVRVEDASIDEMIQRMREEAAESVPVEDRPSQNGDIVSVDIVGKYVEPAEEEDLKTDGLDVELGAEGVQEEFNENLLGVRVGDVREFRVAYPADFTSKGLAGKTLDFTATVIAVRQRELPELDDEFAKTLGEYESLQDLRTKLRAEREEEAKKRSETGVRNALVSQLVDLHPVELPASLVEQQAYRMANDFANMLQRMGLSRQSIREWDWENHLAEARVKAAKDVLSSLLLANIAEAEGISVTGEEMDAEIQKMADQAGLSLDEAKANLTKNDALSSIESRLLHEKALSFIVENANITVREITAEEERAEREQAMKQAAEPEAAEPEAAPTETQAAQQS